MKTISFCLSILLFSIVFPGAQAQTDGNQSWEQRKEIIISEEKEGLKKEVIAINDRLENKEISEEEAVKLKKEAAKKHALNIKNRLAILTNEFEWSERSKDDFPEEWEEFGMEEASAETGNNGKYQDRTSSTIVIAAGFNNALRAGQSLEESDFKIAGSRFFEIGWAWKTRVFKKSNWLRLRYGISLQFNGLKPTENRYFVEDGEFTYLEEFPLELEKSKFRRDNLVIPVHFEIGPSTRKETDSELWFSTEDKLKIGFGGFAGLNIGERQKLKYEQDGENTKSKLKNDYNTNDLVYGLSGYVGWGELSLYVKYGLNPIFEEPNDELHNISLGLRFDLD